jgi:hypothetical protein
MLDWIQVIRSAGLRPPELPQWNRSAKKADEAHLWQIEQAKLSVNRTSILVSGRCETSSYFPLVLLLVLVLVLEIQSVKTARTDSIAPCHLF